MLRKKLYEKRDWIYGILVCFALMAALNTDLSEIQAEAAGGGFFVQLAMGIKMLEYLFPVFNYRDAILAFFVFYFFLKSREQWKESVPGRVYRLPAALTAFFLVFGYSFYYTNSWNLILMDGFHMAVSAVMFCGYYILFARIYGLLLNSIYTRFCCYLHFPMAFC